MRPRLYAFKDLMDRLTTDVWFVIDMGDEQYAFAQMA